MIQCNEWEVCYLQFHVGRMLPRDTVVEFLKSHHQMQQIQLQREVEVAFACLFFPEDIP